MGGNGATDADLWGAGARRWLRHVRRYVRGGRRTGLDTHRVIRRRFAEHWSTLESETWQPLMRRAHERRAGVWGAGMHDWRHGFLAIALETAYWWAFELETESGRSRELRCAVNDLRGINRKVGELAERMAELLERGAELRNRFALDAEWTAPGPDLWGLLEAVAQHFPGTCLDPMARLDEFLRYMRGTTRRTPELGDLMSALARCVPGEPFALVAGDAEALGKTQGAQPDAWPTRVRQLFATLADPAHRWDYGTGRYVTMLDCFDAQSLASLACVAAGFNPYDGAPPSLGVAAIEKALSRFRDDA